jgi:hypothetical protein
MLFKRSHIVRLWEECEAAHGDKWTIIDTQQTFVSKRVKKSGNPQNMGESLATRKWLADIRPDLIVDSSDYKRAYDKVKRIRRLGRRLHRLKAFFGEGILGLIQCSKSMSTTCIPQNITDSM